MKKWKSGISMLMTAAMVLGNLAPAMPVAAAAGTSLVLNGGFEEENLQGWNRNSWCVSVGATMERVPAGDGITPAKGSYCLRETTPGSGSQVTQVVNGLTAGKDYWLTGQIYQTVSGAYTFGFQNSTEKPQFHIQQQEKTNEWIKTAVRFTMWEGASNPVIYTWLGSGTAYLDDLELYESPDFSGLETKLTSAREELAKTGIYTAETLSVLRTAVEKAEAITDIYSYENAQKSQGDVDDVSAGLQTALDGLKKQVEDTNLIVNGDFADGLEGWGFWPQNAVIDILTENGVHTAAFDATAAANGINQDVNVEAGQWYEFTAEVYSDTAAGISIAQKSSDTDKSFAENTKVNEWEKLSVVFQAPGTSRNFSVWQDKGSGKARNVKLVKTQNPNPPGEVIESDETFYIDAQNGDDANAGTSRDQAWQTFANVKRLRLLPGGKLLLKAGCVWNGEQLKIQEAAGTEENPVIVGRYGGGADPVINGQGNPWQTNTNAPKEDVAAVHIYNCKYTTVQNLEVTNLETDTTDLMSDNAPNKQSKYLLTGILAENHDGGDLQGVVIKNNYIHDVNSRMEPGGQKGAGGVIALVTGNAIKSKFTDLQIIGNKVSNVCHEAIYMESSWASRVLVGSQQAGGGNWVGWPNVYVADNYVYDVAGDGIVLINCDGGIAEKNLIVKSASESWDYKRNPAHAAIWMWDCNNVTMQYNEAAHTESRQDGMAFDFDYGNQNVMYQYNYSHDNKGGFWMSCPGPNYTVNAVARYNVSINDGGFDGARILRIGEKGSIGNQFYNNTMYWNHGYQVNAVEQASWGTPPSSGTDIYNNIFWGDSDMVVKNAGVTYRNNCVYGTVADAYQQNAEDPGVVAAEPQFVDVSQYTEGSFADGTVTLGSPDGFRLKATSPCIDAGIDFMAPPEESFSAVAGELVKTQITIENRDYEGNPAPYQPENGVALVDIGAFEYQGESEAERPVVDKTYLEALAAMADGYDEADFEMVSWNAMQEILGEARIVLYRPLAAQDTIDNYAQSLADAIQALVKTEDIKENTAGNAENVLKNYNPEKDNADFEAGTSGDWGSWKSSVSVTAESAHKGTHSLKVTKASSGTAYSEIGKVPVKPNTAYICEAWIKCDDSQVNNVAIEAKHHKDTTGVEDMKLGNAKPVVNSDKDGWKKVRLEFTTLGYDEISLSINSDIPTAYLDDVTLFEKYTVTKEELDTTAIDMALALTPEKDASEYTESSWAAYQAAVLAAKLEKVNAKATENSVAKAAQDLTDAFHALKVDEPEPVVDKKDLQKLYDDHKDDVQGSFTDASWKDFQDALEEARTVLNDDSVGQGRVDEVKANLEAKIKALVIEPEPVVDKKELKKLYDDHKDDVQGNFTDASWKDFQKAMEKAKDVLGDETADQALVNQTKADLETALKGLRENTKPVVDKSKLQSLFDKHKNDKQGSYTDTSWKNFAAAMKNAKTVLENEKASQTDVDKAKTTLENAIKNLKKKAASTTDKNSPKTGDETPIAALAVLLTLSGAAVVVFEKKRRYRR